MELESIKMMKNNFLFFSLFVLIIIILLSLGISWMTCKGVKKELISDLQIEANRIENGLNSLLVEIKSLLIYAGKRIAKDNHNDPQIIWKHLQEVLGPRELRKAWDGPSFGWANLEDRLIVTAEFGVLANGYDLSMRNYPKAARVHPWRLHLDPPVLGKPLNTWSIAGGVGVEDESGNYLGTIALGLDLNYLTLLLENALASSNVEFALFHEHGKLIIHSPSDKNFYASEPFLHSLLSQTQNPKQTYEITDQEIIFAAYAVHLEHYPFIIITYIQSNVLYREWLRELFPHILEVGGIGILSLLILFLFWKAVLKKNRKLDVTKRNLENMLALARASDAAKEDFLRSTNQEMMVPLTAIKNHIDTLLKNLKHETETDFVQEKETKLLDEILEHALDFKNLTNHVLDITDVDLKEIIEACVIIHAKAAYEKEVTFVINIDDNLPKLQGDELKIKQIFVSFLGSAIKFSLPNEKIFIYGSQQLINDKNYIKIFIQENGFWFFEDSIQSVNDETLKIYRDNHLEMNYETIERLVHMHRGTCRVENFPGKGTHVTLLFPLHFSGKVAPIKGLGKNILPLKM